MNALLSWPQKHLVWSIPGAVLLGQVQAAAWYVQWTDHLFGTAPPTPASAARV